MNNYIADELLKLKQLLDDGAITQKRSQYEAQKKKLLATDVDDILEIPTNQPQKSIPLPTKKKKKWGCLVAFLLFGASSVVIMQQATTPGTSFYDDIHSKANELTPEDWLKFDDKTWADFTTLYKNHNAMLSLIDSYSQGTVDAATLYSKCEEFKNSFR